MRLRVRRIFWQLSLAIPSMNGEGNRQVFCTSQLGNKTAHQCDVLLERQLARQRSLDVLEQPAVRALVLVSRIPICLWVAGGPSRHVGRLRKKQAVALLFVVVKAVHIGELRARRLATLAGAGLCREVVG